MPETAPNLESIRAQLASALSLEKKDVPDPVVIHALNDPLYLHHLLAVRNEPRFLALLFREAEHISTIRLPERSTAELMESFVKSMVKWAASGFRTLSKEVRDQRFMICQSCPHLTAAPVSQLYQLMQTRQICGKCGCDVHKKTSIATETCPENRWLPVEP